MKKHLSNILIIAIFLVNGIFAPQAIGQNSAISFNGSIYNNNYIDILNGGVGSVLNFTTGNFTIEVWIRPSFFATSSNNHEHTIAGNDDTATGGGYVLRTGGSRKLSFSYNYGGGWQEIVTATPVLQVNQWQHVAVSKNAGNIILYLDGQVVASANLTTNINIATSAKTFKIGVNGSLNNRKFHGIMDEVKIWNVIRTQQQVESDGTEICGSFPGNLVAYYKLNEPASYSLATIICSNNASLNGIINGTLYPQSGSLLFPGGSTVIYVDCSHTATGCGAQVGYSWATAFSDLDTALDVAFRHPQIEKIYVAQGIYYPRRFPYTMQNDGTGVQQTSTLNKNRTFHLRPGLEVFGGFPPGGGIQNTALHVTVLDGSRAGGVLYDTSLCVVYMDTSDYWTKPNDTTKLVGFTVRNGKAQVGFSGINQGSGGGIYCYGGLQLIQNCIFTNNFSTNGGGAIATKQARTSIINNRFNQFCDVETSSGYNYVKGNYFDRTGIVSRYGQISIIGNEIGHARIGIYTDMTEATIKDNNIHDMADHGMSITQSPETFIIGNTITDNNTSNYNGGGIYLYGGNHIITDNVIMRNTARLGGGLYFFGGKKTISRNLFSDNVSTSYGGGIYGHNGENKLDANIVQKNTAVTAAGIFLAGARDTVINNFIIQNTASSSEGGASLGGTQYTMVANNLIAENQARNNSGLSFASSNSQDKIINNTFYNNRTTDSTRKYHNGALVIWSGQQEVANNIFWKNKIGNSDTVTGADYSRNDGSHTFKNNAMQNPTASYTMGGGGKFDIGINAANNVFAVDPLFANPNNMAGIDGVFATNDDGLQLINGSPLMDIGDSSLLPAFITGDISGVHRISGSNIDLGAYELGCSPANISTSPSACKGNSAVLRVNSVSPFQNIYWYPDSLSTIVLDTGYSYLTPPLYSTDTFWVSVAGCSDSAKKPVIVNVPDAVIIQDSLTLRANSGVTAYQWLTCNPYQVIPGANDSSYTVTLNGSYTVVIEQYGCFDTAGCITITGVGIEQHADVDAIIIRPNPTNGIVTISAPANLNNAILYVSNMQGKVIYKMLVEPGKSQQVDLGPYPGGMYFFILSGTDQYYSTKIIKQ